LIDSDQVKELSCTGSITITLLTPPEFANHFVYFKNVGTGLVTIDAGASYIIKGNSTRYYTLGPGGTVQLQSNGVDWHVMTTVGGWQLVEYQDASGDTSLLFENLIPGLQYKLVVEIVQTGVAYHLVTFNADSSNYTGVLIYGLNSPAYGTPVANTAGITLSQGVDTYLDASVEFSSIHGDDKKVKVTGTSNWYDNSAASCLGITGGRYSGAANLTSVTLTASGGIFTGRVSLYYLS